MRKCVCYVIMLCMAFVLSSCVKHDIYNTEHPDLGALVVTTDFSNRSAEAVVPIDYMIKVDDTEMSAQGTTNVFSKLLSPNDYGLLVYNKAEGFSFNGSIATVNATRNGYIEPLPDYLFGSYQRISVVADDTTRVVARMTQYVKYLNVNLNVTEGDYDRVSSVVCTLDGVESGVDLSTGELQGLSASIENTMTQNGDKLQVSFRILGIVPTTKQTLTVTITFTDGSTQTVESDLTALLSNFNDSGTAGMDVSGELRLPIGMGTVATIANWQVANNGEDISIR